MIAGFNFTKINAEKTEVARGKISVNNNVTLKEVVESDVSFGKQKQNAVSFKFEFTSQYDPSIGLIKFEGDVLYIDEPKYIKEILASWKNEKKIKKELMAGIINVILTKCNIEAMILSQQINLPSPIPLPKVGMVQEGQSEDKSKKEKYKEYIG